MARRFTTLQRLLSLSTRQQPLRLAPLAFTTGAILYGIASTWPNTSHDQHAGSTRTLQPSSKKYMDRYLAPPSLLQPGSSSTTTTSSSTGTSTSTSSTAAVAGGVVAAADPLAHDPVAAAQFATLAAHFGIVNRAAFAEDCGSSVTEGMGHEELDEEDQDEGEEAGERAMGIVRGDGAVEVMDVRMYDDEEEDEDDDEHTQQRYYARPRRRWRDGVADALANGAIWAQAVVLGDFATGGWRWPRRVLYESQACARRRLAPVFVQVSGEGCGDVYGEDGNVLWAERDEMQDRRLADGEVEYEDEDEEDEGEGQDDDGKQRTTNCEPDEANAHGIKASMPSSTAAAPPQTKLYTLHHWLTANGHEREMQPAEIAAGLRARTEPVLITWLHNERYLHMAFAARQSADQAWWSLARIWGTDDFGDAHVEAALALRNPIYIQIETDSRPWARVLVDMM